MFLMAGGKFMPEMHLRNIRFKMCLSKLTRESMFSTRYGLWQS